MKRKKVNWDKRKIKFENLLVKFKDKYNYYSYQKKIIHFSD